MPRKPRQLSQTGVYHFINRGINKKKIFHRENDYGFYLGLMKSHADELGIGIHHYCLMNNHTHILLSSQDLDSLSRFGHYLQRRYAYYYCKTYHWAEQVFRKRFVSLPINEDRYLLECGRYIERNPVRAKLVKSPSDYKYSSYHYYAFGKKDEVVSCDPLYEEMGKSGAERMKTYREYLESERAYEQIVDKTLGVF